MRNLGIITVTCIAKTRQYAVNNTIHDAARDVIFSVVVSSRLTEVQIFLFRGLKPDVKVYRLSCTLRYSGQGTNLATYLHLVPKLERVELYPHTFVAWCSIRYRKFTYHPLTLKYPLIWRTNSHTHKNEM